MVLILSLSFAPFADILVNSLRRQTILTQLLHHESEAMVRILLRDPLPGAADGSDSGIQIIGPISLSRQDSLDAIEQKIQVHFLAIGLSSFASL